MLARAVHFVRIARELARVGIVRKSQLQLEFWCQVIMDCLWYASHVAVFEVFYGQVDVIAGWQRHEFRVLLGFLFVSDAFMMIWLTQMWRFGRDLKDGKIDPYRVRPVSTFLLYGFQQFSLEGTTNMLFALGYLVYGVAIAIEQPSALTVLSLVGCIALSFWVRFVVVMLFSGLEVFLVGSDAMRFVSELFHTTSDRPMDIFGARLKAFLIYVVPVGALTYVPAAIVLGRFNRVETFATVAWLLAFGLFVFWAWHRALRRYESAMG